MASRERKPPATSSLRFSSTWRPFMIDRPLVEAFMKESAPCWSWVFFCGLSPAAVTMRPWRLPVAVRTRCSRARLS